MHITVSHKGAELQNITANGREYLWQGDPKFWGRRAPILFPIVGKLADDNLRINGHEYTMKQHGFARDTEFVEQDGWYTSKEEVALYIHTYGRLPGNFISKTKARNRGWDASLGNLDEVCPGMSIGGSRYYNDDGQLPDKKGRQWTECDINYSGGFRGAERIVFSNDGLVFYTADHYETFEQLY